MREREGEREWESERESHVLSIIIYRYQCLIFQSCIREIKSKNLNKVQNLSNSVASCGYVFENESLLFRVKLFDLCPAISRKHWAFDPTNAKNVLADRGGAYACNFPVFLTTIFKYHRQDQNFKYQSQDDTWRYGQLFRTFFCSIFQASHVGQSKNYIMSKRSDSRLLTGPFEHNSLYQ